MTCSCGKPATAKVLLLHQCATCALKTINAAANAGYSVMAVPIEDEVSSLDDARLKKFLHTRGFADPKDVPQERLMELLGEVIVNGL